MAEPHVVSLLTASQERIGSLIADYEERLKAARRDVASLDCVISLFERERTPIAEQRPVSVSPLFKRGQIFGICLRALREHPEGLDTRELAIECLKEGGYDSDDPVLRRGLATNVKNVMKMRALAGAVSCVCIRRGVTLWRATISSRQDA